MDVGNCKIYRKGIALSAPIVVSGNMRLDPKTKPCSGNSVFVSDTRLQPCSKSHRGCPVSGAMMPLSVPFSSEQATCTSIDTNLMHPETRLPCPEATIRHEPTTSPSHKTPLPLNRAPNESHRPQPDQRGASAKLVAQHNRTTICSAAVRRQCICSTPSRAKHGEPCGSASETSGNEIRDVYQSKLQEPEKSR